VEELRQRLLQSLLRRAPQVEPAAGGLWLAQAQGLSQMRAALARAEAALAEGEPLDWVAEDLRHALAALGAVRGRTLPEDLLDRIFARFCLGK
jgi:tRNA modification GTPase